MGPDALASLAMAKMQMAARHITSKKERRQVVKLAKERIMKDVAKRHKRSPASVHKKHVAATEHKTGSVGHHKKKAVAKVVISKHVQPNATEVMMNVAKALTATLKRTVKAAVSKALAVVVADVKASQRGHQAAHRPARRVVGYIKAPGTNLRSINRQIADVNAKIKATEANILAQASNHAKSTHRSTHRKVHTAKIQSVSRHRHHLRRKTSLLTAAVASAQLHQAEKDWEDSKVDPLFHPVMAELRHVTGQHRRWPQSGHAQQSMAEKDVSDADEWLKGLQKYMRVK